MHLVPALYPRRHAMSPIGPAPVIERSARGEERALRDLVHLVPRFRQHRRRLEQDAEFAQPGGMSNGELRLDAPLLTSVPVKADDPPLAEALVAAHVPFPGRARGARDRIGPAHDPDDQIAAERSQIRRAPSTPRRGPRGPG